MFDFFSLGFFTFIYMAKKKIIGIAELIFVETFLYQISVKNDVQRTLDITYRTEKFVYYREKTFKIVFYSKQITLTIKHACKVYSLL